MINTIEELQNHVQKKLKTECNPGDQNFDEYLTLQNWISKNRPHVELDFPFEINESEKPDFLLSGASATGIEVTTFQIPQEARARAMTQGLPLQNHASNLGFASPRHSRDELISRMASPPISAGQFRDIGDDINVYADKILSIIAKKEQKVIIEGDIKCDVNILLIEDRKPLSSFIWDRLIEKTTPYIHEGFARIPHFNEIWLIDGDTADPKTSVIWRETNST